MFLNGNVFRTSKILVLFTVNIAADPEDHAAIRLVRGTTNIFVGSDSDSGQNVTGSVRMMSDDQYHVVTISGQYLDSPSTTSETTYKITAETNDLTILNRLKDTMLGPNDKFEDIKIKASNFLLVCNLTNRMHNSSIIQLHFNINDITRN